MSWRIESRPRDITPIRWALLGRLDASFRAQRQFVANASHELRTPLARQRTLLEVGAIAAAHGADLRAVTRAGGGLAIEVVFPVVLPGQLGLVPGARAMAVQDK